MATTRSDSAFIKRFEIDMRVAVAKTTTGATSAGLEEARKWLNKASRRANIDIQKKQKDINKRVAQQAKVVTLNSYTSQKQGRPSYRWADQGRSRRFSKGKMDKFIKSADYISYDKDRLVLFRNPDIIDSKAPQIFRLSFGSGGKEPRNTKPMRFGNQVSIKTIGYRHMTSGARIMFMPAGSWIGTAYASTSKAVRSRKIHTDGSFFYPARGGIKGGTKADHPNAVRNQIKGTHFLEDGANYINQNYPKEITKVVKEWGINTKNTSRVRKSIRVK